MASEHSAWRHAVQHGLSQFEEMLVQQAEAKRQSQNEQNQELDRRQIVFVFSVEGLSLSNWPSQPQHTLFQVLYSEHVAIVS